MHWCPQTDTTAHSSLDTRPPISTLLSKLGKKFLSCKGAVNLSLYTFNRYDNGLGSLIFFNIHYINMIYSIPEMLLTRACLTETLVQAPEAVFH